jgi:hypothetical protein
LAFAKLEEDARAIACLRVVVLALRDAQRRVTVPAGMLGELARIGPRMHISRQATRLLLAERRAPREKDRQEAPSSPHTFIMRRIRQAGQLSLPRVN